MNQIHGVHKLKDISNRLKEIRSPFWIPVSGTSMGRVFKKGDLAHVIPLDPAEVCKLQAGSLILFVNDLMPVIHRFLKVEDGQVFEYGDNSKIINEIDIKSVVGYIDLRRRKNRDKIIKVSLYRKIKIVFGFL